MAELSLTDIFNFLKTTGLTGGLLLIRIASMQGRFVWRREYEKALADEHREKEELRKERDIWRQEYLRASGAANELRAALAYQARGAE